MKTILSSYTNIIIILIALSSTTWVFHIIIVKNKAELLESDKHTGLHIAKQQKDTYFNHVNNILKSASSMPEITSVATTSEVKISNEILMLISQTFPGAIAYIINSEGVVVDCTPYNDKGDTFIGKDLNYRPYFQLAKTKDYVVYPAVGELTKLRGLYFSKGLFNKEKFLGVIVLKLPITMLEEDLQNEGNLNVALMTPEGIIFASSDNKFLFKTFFEIPEIKLKAIKESKQFSGTNIERIGTINRNTITIKNTDYNYEVLNAGYTGWKILIFKKTASYKLPQSVGIMLWSISILLILLLFFYFKYKLAVADNSQ